MPQFLAGHMELSGDLVVLEAQPCGVWVAAVVEEGHGGEDGAANWGEVWWRDGVMVLGCHGVMLLGCLWCHGVMV